MKTIIKTVRSFLSNAIRTGAAIQYARQGNTKLAIRLMNKKAS